MARCASRIAVFALAAVAMLAGCKGFWDPPSSGGGGGGGSASGVFYVLNQQTNQVAGFSFPSGSTTLTNVSGSPYTLGAAPLALAMAPGGKFLYVSTAGGIFVYSIGTGGALTLLNNQQPIDQNDLPTAMAVDSTGTWLLVCTSGAGVINAVPISTSTGLLDSARSEQNATLSGSTIQQIAVTPSGAASGYVFLAMGTSGTTVLTFDATASNPFSKKTPYSVKNSGGADTAVAVDPSGRLLYVGETVASPSPQTGGLRVFTIGSSSPLTEVSGSPYPTGGTGPSAILALSNFVYVANRAVSGSSTGNITGYPVASVGGSYSLGTLINTVSAGQATVGLAQDSTKTYVLAVNASGNPDLSAFTADATTGKLTAGPTAATGKDPVQAIAIAAVP